MVLMLQELPDIYVQASSAHTILLRFLSTSLADLTSEVEFLMRVAFIVPGAIVITSLFQKTIATQN